MRLKVAGREVTLSLAPDPRFQVKLSRLDTDIGIIALNNLNRSVARALKELLTVYVFHAAFHSAGGKKPSVGSAEESGSGGVPVGGSVHGSIPFSVDKHTGFFNRKPKRLQSDFMKSFRAAKRSASCFASLTCFWLTWN